MEEFREITLEEFKAYCNKGKCLRKTLVSNKCEKESKQEKCYYKFLNQKEKVFNRYVNKIKKEIDFTKQIHERDKTCRIWNILTKNEKAHVLKYYLEDYKQLSKDLDVCHIISRKQNPSLMKNINNVVLVSRYFHQLLDFCRHPVNQKGISEDEKIKWFESALKGKRLI